MRAARRADLLALGPRDRRSGYPLEMVLAGRRRAAGGSPRCRFLRAAHRPLQGHRHRARHRARHRRHAPRPGSGAGVTRRPGAPTLLVLAKAPRAGYSKTRLAPLFGEQGAAALAAAALADTLDAVASARACRRVLVLDGALAATGPLAVPVPVGVDVLPQAAGTHAGPDRGRVRAGRRPGAARRDGHAAGHARLADPRDPDGAGPRVARPRRGRRLVGDGPAAPARARPSGADGRADVDDAHGGAAAALAGGGRPAGRRPPAAAGRRRARGRARRRGSGTEHAFRQSSSASRGAAPARA